MSRQDAVKYCQDKHKKQSIIISISDPNIKYDAAPFCSQQNNVTAILPLCFSDAAGPGKDVYGIDVEESDMMSDEDALKVAKLVRANRDKRIIVHCDAGISRSAGVGAAIAQFFNGDARLFFESGQYDPNMWCFTKMMTAFLET